MDKNIKHNNMLSIVIVTCNRVTEILSTINSCLLKINEEFELIIIDNNSTDRTEIEIRNLAVKKNLTLIYEKNLENHGVAKSRNQGYNIARGDIVYFIDDDAIVCEDSCLIDEVLVFMRYNLKYAVVGTHIFNVTGNYYQHGVFFTNKETQKKTTFNYIGASHFINKREIGDIELYPVEFRYGGEELFLSYFLRFRGFEVFFYDTLKVHHIPSKNTRMDKSSTLIMNNSNAFNVKRYFTPIVFIPLVWLVMLIRILYNSKNYVRDFKKYLFQINSTYNKKYINRISLNDFIMLIKQFGFKTLL